MWSALVVELPSLSSPKSGPVSSRSCPVSSKSGSVSSKSGPVSSKSGPVSSKSGPFRRQQLVRDPLSYFSFQPVIHDWCNKGRGMCCPVCGMVHIKEPLLLIGKSIPCGGCGFPLWLCVVLYHMSDAI